MPRCGFLSVNDQQPGPVDSAVFARSYLFPASRRRLWMAAAAPLYAAAATVEEFMRMPAISKTGTAVSAVKTAAVVMVLALFVSVAGFVTPAGPTAPAAAQNSECVSTTVIAHTTGEATTRTDCYETGTTDLDGDLPLGHVWCSVTFGVQLSRVAVALR